MLDAIDGDNLLYSPLAVFAVPVEHRARKRRADEAALGLRIVKPANLEGDEAVVPQVDGLLESPLLEIPEVETPPVAARADVIELEPRLVGIRFAELGRDEDVLARLVPEVVVERRSLPRRSPNAP